MVFVENRCPAQENGFISIVIYLYLLALVAEVAHLNYKCAGPAIAATPAIPPALLMELVELVELVEVVEEE